jgi:hypothetical protein
MHLVPPSRSNHCRHLNKFNYITSKKVIYLAAVGLVFGTLSVFVS